MEIQKPNLFEYATSELSQDAFLCWLFEYGTENNKGDEVYKVAHEFLEAISKQLPTEKRFDENCQILGVKKQYNNIDVLIELSNGVNIIIEDKTSAHIHDNQLEKYENRLIKKDGIKKEKIIKVYLKTSDYVKEEKTADATINRSNIIKIIEFITKNPNNLILRDYYNHLISMQKRKDNWKLKKDCINDWNDSEWIGYLEKEVLSDLKENYSYGIGNVHPRGGVFLACWWSEKGQEAPYIYRQIEIKSTKRIRLAFKIENKSKDGYKQCPIADLQNIIRSVYNKYKNGNRSGESSSFSYFDINLKKGDITLKAFEEHLKLFKEFEMEPLYNVCKNNKLIK